MPLFKEVALPKQWEDERIQSAAALLSFGPDVEVKPELAEQAAERLASFRDDNEGISPDEIYAALRKHEFMLGLQEADPRLLRNAFRIRAPWNLETADESEE